MEISASGRLESSPKAALQRTQRLISRWLSKGIPLRCTCARTSPAAAQLTLDSAGTACVTPQLPNTSHDSFGRRLLDLPSCSRSCYLELHARARPTFSHHCVHIPCENCRSLCLKKKNNKQAKQCIWRVKTLTAEGMEKVTGWCTYSWCKSGKS